MNALDALRYFVSMGWTPAQSAGIVANLAIESNLDPAAVGDDGQAYGVAQWHPDRQAHFAAIMGKDICGSSAADQLAFVHAELLDSEGDAGDALAACTKAGEAAVCVSIMYERPADREGEAIRRATLAEQLYREFSPAVAVDGTPPPVPSVTTKPSAPPGAPTRTEKLTDLPDNERETVIKQFEAAGATVEGIRQADGKWTIVATFGGKR